MLFLKFFPFIFGNALIYTYEFPIYWFPFFLIDSLASEKGAGAGLRASGRAPQEFDRN
jgi:hypothetical protein